MISEHEYRLMYAVEDEHWWFEGMETIVRALLCRHLGAGRGLRILDAGCGTGRNLRFLREFGEPVGLDYSELALDCCRERGFTELVHASVNAMPLPDQSFDLITSFDVLDTEGVDPPGALREMHRLLAPGGHLLLRVPAFDWLRGSHDRHWNVAHRFHARELRAVLTEAGFIVLRASYANMWLFPLAAVKRWSEMLLPKPGKSDLAANVGGLDALFEWVLGSEAPLVASCGLPFGLSLIAVARKPDAAA